MITPSLETLAQAVYARAMGTPYSEALESHEVSPAQFCRAITRSFPDLVDRCQGKIRELLQATIDSEEKTIELFNMGEDHIREQYEAVLNRKQGRFYEGTYKHPENIGNLVYIALTHHIPELKSSDRKTVVEAIKKLPTDLALTFHRFKLAGLMHNALSEEDKGSPTAILKIYDKEFQKRTGNKSLFDLDEEHHLHMWGDEYKAPRSYWQDPKNSEEAIYHTLTEQHPTLASTDRRTVIEGINNLPVGLSTHMQKIGLSGVMQRAVQIKHRSSPLELLQIFDTVYQRKTGDKSLFDLKEEHHLHIWGERFKAPDHYWKNPENVEEAIYHVLTENLPGLKSEDRMTVVATINQIPSDRANYFISVGLETIMAHGFPAGQHYSPRAVLEAFNRAYMRKTGKESLIDNQQKYITL